MVSRVITIPADPDRLWEALTEPADLDAWFGAHVEWELVPGGGAHFEADGNGEPDRVGRVESVTPARELRFSWWPTGDEDAASEVRFILEPVDGGTRLTVTEEPVAVPIAEGGPPTITDTCEAPVLELVARPLGAPFMDACGARGAPQRCAAAVRVAA